MSELSPNSFWNGGIGAGVPVCPWVLYTFQGHPSVKARHMELISDLQ